MFVGMLSFEMFFLTASHFLTTGVCKSSMRISPSGVTTLTWLSIINCESLVSTPRLPLLPTGGLLTSVRLRRRSKCFLGRYLCRAFNVLHLEKLLNGFEYLSYTRRSSVLCHFHNLRVRCTHLKHGTITLRWVEFESPTTLVFPTNISSPLASLTRS